MKTTQDLAAELKAKEQECRRLYKKLMALRHYKQLKVSDHAIVRFMERVELCPVAVATERMRSEQVKMLYRELGDGTFPIGEGTVRVVVCRGVIVTVIP